jgi:acid phosphatase (class A)
MAPAMRPSPRSELEDSMGAGSRVGTGHALAAIVAIAALAALAGCAARAVVPAAAGATVGTAPASAPAAATCARPGASDAGYRTLDGAAAMALLGPPPEAGSEAQQRDLEAVLAAQRAARDTPRRALAIADSKASCARFADALGAEVPAAALPFLDRVAWQASAVTGAAKRHYRRARPYVGQPAVERLADAIASPAEAADRDVADAHDFSSYPSGHSAFGAACAILLAGMVPERAAALFERARSYAESREIVGAHFPRDVEAGRMAGELAMAFIRQDPCFRADEAQARSTMRAALQLPVEAAGAH